MSKLARLSWFLVGFLCTLVTFDCKNRPNPIPVGAGGFYAAGGTSSKGGSSMAGSAGTSVAGNTSTGGRTSTEPALVWPTCPEEIRTRGVKDAPIRNLNGWRPDPAWSDRVLLQYRARSAEINYPEKSVNWASNNSIELDQGLIGACIGFGSANDASTLPFLRRSINVDGQLAYRIATRIDRGCPPMTEDFCKGAYPNADPGSYSSSGMQAGVLLGWWKRWSVAQDVPTLIQRLQRGPCGIGKVWRDSEFEISRKPETCGKLFQHGKPAGRHFVAITKFDAESSPRRFWIDNSWGKWGACENGRCSYAYLDEGDLKFQIDQGEAEIVCPSKD